jgi:hypothetical protein
MVSVAVVLLSGCRRDSSNRTAVPLSFYVVSDHKIEGGRFIDTPDFPKLGYIAATPDLVVKRLESVALDVSPPFSETRPAVSIAMGSQDALSFTALTERAIEKKLLLMQGDTPLIAPRVKARSQTASLMLTFGEGTDPKKAADDLKKLVQ